MDQMTRQTLFAVAAAIEAGTVTLDDAATLRRLATPDRRRSSHVARKAAGKPLVSTTTR